MGKDGKKQERHGGKGGGSAPNMGGYKSKGHSSTGVLPGRSAMPGMSLTVGKGNAKRTTRFV